MSKKIRQRDMLDFEADALRVVETSRTIAEVAASLGTAESLLRAHRVSPTMTATR